MVTLDDIASNPELVELLAWPYDIDVTRRHQDASWIRLSPDVSLTLLAGDGAGGVFIAYGDRDDIHRPILHATSEGQAGRVAANLEELLALTIQLPYWRDLLKFSGGGSVAEMRRSADFLAIEFAGEYPELPDSEKRIRELLTLPVIADPIPRLADSIAGTDCTVVAADGWQYESLFGQFTAGDNRRWNPAKE